MSAEAPTVPVPPAEDDEAFFWEATARGELPVQVCGDCGRRTMPLRPMCPGCGSSRRESAVTSGRGTIWSFCVPHPPLLPEFADRSYAVIVVALDEDPSLRFVGNLLARDDGTLADADPATITIGDPVRVTFVEVDGVALPYWVPEPRA